MAEPKKRIRRNRTTILHSLTDYARFCGFEPAAHHRLIIEHLEAVSRGTIDNLLIFAPPGSAKSTYVSVLFPVWYFAHHPTHNVLAATHAAEFADRWGRRVRNDILRHGRMLKLSLARDSRAAARFALKRGGEYYGVGAGAGIAGFRADLGIIDDPFGSREDAYSSAVRRKRWDWYLDDYSTRLKPGARRVIMHTRWHEDDIAGRVLEQIAQGLIKAAVISIPAVAEANDILGRKPGEYLWDDPQGYNYGASLRARQRETSPMMWAALYQQRPAPEEGDYFKADWLRPYVTAPARDTLRVYGASDYAVTADGGDYTVHLVAGIDHDGRLYLLDLWRRQAAADQWIEAFCDLVRAWKPIAWAEETGQIKAGVGPFLERRMRERRAYVMREAFPARADKAVRAQAIRGRMALDGLYVPASAPWSADFRAELLSFPAGRHDDQVDALGLIGQLLDRIQAPARPVKDEKARTQGYRLRPTDNTDDWKTW